MNLISYTILFLCIFAFGHQASADSKYEYAIVEFVVLSTGDCAGIEFNYTKGKNIEKVVTEMLKSAKIEPGLKDGVPVSVRVRVLFKMDEEKKVERIQTQEDYDTLPFGIRARYEKIREHEVEKANGSRR